MIENIDQLLIILANNQMNVFEKMLNLRHSKHYYF